MLFCIALPTLAAACCVADNFALFGRMLAAAAAAAAAETMLQTCNFQSVTTKKDAT